jgi:hypothetical protein
MRVGAADVPGGAQVIVTALVALRQAPQTGGAAGFVRLYARHRRSRGAGRSGRPHGPPVVG